MRARTLVLLLLAVVLAGGTAFLARAWLAAQRQAEMAEAAPMALPAPAKSVLVARTDIKRGQILRPDEMVWQAWPEGGLDKNYVVMGTKTPESYAGWVARNPLAGGEPITESKIIAPGNRGFLAAVLQPGTRAISVPVTVTSGISGFIFPGDQVDLLITHPIPVMTSASDQNKQQSYEHKVAETVLRNIRVIAIDQRLESKAGEAVVAHTATLEVTPKQSEVIALATEIGKLSLSLRSLVPGASDQPDEIVAEKGNKATPDSPLATAASYTVDSEVSTLLPKHSAGKDGSESATVTILRGAAKASEAADLGKSQSTSQAATKPGG